MDPDANLAEQLELAASILRVTDTGNASPHDLINDADRLASLVEAMHEWLSKEGKLPIQWDRNS